MATEIIAPPKSVVKITKWHIRVTKLGKKIKKINEEIKQLLDASKTFKKGSAPYQSLTEKTVNFRKDRQALVHERDKYVGLKFVLHGGKATQDRLAAVIFGLEEFERQRHKYKGRAVYKYSTLYILKQGVKIFHVWFSTDKNDRNYGRWLLHSNPPSSSNFGVFCANNARATCYLSDGSILASKDCVCADRSTPRRQ